MRSAWRRSPSGVTQTGTVDRVPASALFIFIGAEPNTEWLDGFVERDESGFLLTGQDLIHNGQRPGHGRSTATPACWNPACPACSLSATCGMAR